MRHARKSFATLITGRHFLQNTPEIVAQLFHLLITIARLFCHTSIEDLLQTRWQRFLSQFLDRTRRIVKHGMPDVDCRLAAKWPGARQHLVKQNAGRKDIRALINLVTASLLRCGIGGCSVGNADFRQVGAMDRFPCFFFIFQQLRQAEIQNFHLSSGRHHHIARLDIAMNNAARMRCGQSVGNLNRN